MGAAFFLVHNCSVMIYLEEMTLHRSTLFLFFQKRSLATKTSNKSYSHKKWAIFMQSPNYLTGNYNGFSVSAK